MHTFVCYWQQSIYGWAGIMIRAKFRRPLLPSLSLIDQKVCWSDKIVFFILKKKKAETLTKGFD